MRENDRYIQERLVDLFPSLSPVGGVREKMEALSDFLEQASQQMEILTSEYRVGVIAPLIEEWAALAHVADKVEISGMFSSKIHDRNIYSVMVVPFLGDSESTNNSKHLVLVAQPPKTGTVAATNSANDMLNHYRSIREIVLVGIAGGISWPSVPSMDIRLGDVVVGSDGIIKHDYVAVAKGDVDWRDGLSEPSISMRQFIRILANKMSSDPHLWEHTSATDSDTRWQRPSEETDIFFDFTCNPPVEVQRGTRPPDILGHSIIHYGRIASGDTLLMDAQLRETLRGALKVCAIEMEAAGVAGAIDGLHHVGVLAIRGISDYADPDKYNREQWRAYAALSAARYFRALLGQIRPNLEQS